MADETLYANLFGAFQLTYQDRMIVIERNDITKCNQLFQILICNPTGISKEQLVLNLFGTESVADPSNSLRALVFRLRRALKSQNVSGGDYVVINQGTYMLDPKLHVQSDIFEFERLAQIALQEENEDQKVQALEKALSLYHNEFLPRLGATDWVVVLQVRFKKIFTECAKQFCELCTKHMEYTRVLAVATAAMTIYPLEGWQTYAVEAMVALGRTNDAIRLYEETQQQMFEELGVALPERMRRQMEMIGSRVRHKTTMMEDVITNLKESAEHIGAFECNYMNFAGNYQLIKRFIERTGQVAWLMLITATDSKGYALGECVRCNALMDELCASITRTLRKGDMFTRYSHNQVLLLLMQTKQEDCHIVFNRICDNLKDKSQSKYYQFHLAPVNELLEKENGTDENT